MSSTLSGILSALLGFALFATHDVIVKLLGNNYSPFQIVFFSVLLGFPLLTVLLITDKTEQNLRPRHPGWVLARAVAVSVTAFSAFYAFSALPLAQTYAILFTSPLLVTVLAIPILGEHVGLHRGAAIVVGLLGVLVVLQPGQTSLGLGHLAALVAAVAGALSSVIMRKIGGAERVVVMMLYPMMGNIVVMGGILPFVYEPVPLLHLAGFALIAILGFLAMQLLLLAYRRAEAIVVAPMQYSQIIWASLYGAAFFNEALTGTTILGTAIIIASGLYIVFRESQFNTSRNRPVLRTRMRPDTGTDLRKPAATASDSE